MKASRKSREATIESRSARNTLIVVASILVVITVVLARSPSISLEGFSILLVLWIFLGYIMYVNAANAFAEEAADGRPWLSVGRGVPAWAFFLAGTLALASIVAAWIAGGRLREALMLVGISIVYASMTFPRRFSLGRAVLSGIGLAISSATLVLLR